MKVETDLRAGSVVDDVTNKATNFVEEVNSLFTEAQSLVDNTNRSATSLWNCLSNAFSW
jgi:hypothetical protein